MAFLFVLGVGDHAIFVELGEALQARRGISADGRHDGFGSVSVLAVLSDLPKTKVYELCRYIDEAHVLEGAPRPLIPHNTMVKPPSAELSLGQKDEDILPPYEVLDEILRLYVEEGRSSAEVIAAGFAEATVREIVRKIDLNEYKRKQAPPGLKISPLAFGVGRRIPIVQRYVPTL